MVQKKLKTYIICLTSSILLLYSSKSQACGFYETEADYRAMMFKVSLPSLRCLQPFNYTTYSFYYLPVDDPLVSDPNGNDRYQNCSEWLIACQNKPSLDDIYKIQYDTDATLFINSYKKNTLNVVFKNNSFVEYLIKHENKSLLDYMLFAKKAELYEVGRSSRFEEWDDIDGYRRWNNNNEDDIPSAKRDLLNDAQNKLNSNLSQFLQERYTFQVCRLYYQLNQKTNAIETYDKCFKNIDRNNLMSVWAGLFKAMSTHSDEYYRLLIQVFDNCDEKKFRSVQLFDNDFDESELTAPELSTATVMLTLRNPGKALHQIKKAYNLNPSNKYIPFLVLREINKLEDWLITPLFFDKYSITNDNPFHCAYYNEWHEEYKKEQAKELENETDPNNQFQQDNLSADMEYMAELKALLTSIHAVENGEIKDFYAISLAHISLLQENTQDAQKFLSMISDKANPSILLQKKLETIWLATKTQDIRSEKFKKVFVENIKDLERISMSNFDNNKMLFTLTLSLANEYLKKGDKVYGNLLRLRSDLYNNHGNEWYLPSYRNGDSYYTIQYFDRNATTNDIDTLIDLLDKPNKTSFEKYLCNQYLSSTNAYKELKGTIAFRNNDLKLAYESFASMPQDYWQSNNFSFRSYLNEDPFIPKGLRADKFRSFDYGFNKAEFIKELIELKEKANQDCEKSADYYNRLGDAYFNTTYWGNSWMMLRYFRSANDIYYTRTDCLPKWMSNYMTAGIAQDYYEKALKKAVNDEQKAYSTIMLRYIYSLNFSFKSQQADKQQAKMLKEKLRYYQHTKTFQKYKSNCSHLL